MSDTGDEPLVQAPFAHRYGLIIIIIIINVSIMSCRHDTRGLEMIGRLQPNHDDM